MVLDNTTNQLCSYCVQIPLSIGQIRRAEGLAQRGQLGWSLGPVSRIRQSNCKLCRFIGFILYEDERTSRSPSHTWRNHDSRIYLRWTEGQIGSKCFLVQDEHPKLETSNIEIYYLRTSETNFRADRAFCLTRNTSQVIDFERIRGWIDMCKIKHVGRCKRAVGTAHYGQVVQDAYPELDVLRFIDVREQCVVETNIVYPYVALSYIWGLSSNLRLTTANRADLTQTNALQRYRYAIPCTIYDAIILTQRIGERYLWCDALCLLQNDPDDINRGVKTMDLIYERAELTIVAACGHDADAGLPGVREGTRLEPKFSEEIIPGVELGGYVTLDDRMRRSVYSSRAWTFQEEVLSRRSLFFIDELVYFRCGSTTLFELFDAALDSRTTEEIVHADPASMLPSAMQMNISYSRAGWKGSIDHANTPRNANSWLDTRTWIVWYRRSARGTLNLVWDILANKDFPFDDSNFVGYRKRKIFQSPIPLSFPTACTQSTEDLGRAIPNLNYPILQFWTLSAFFNIRIRNNISDLALIVDRSGTPCGALYLDDQERTVFSGLTEPYELIAVSENDKYSLLVWLGAGADSPRPEDLGNAELTGLFETERYWNVMLLMWSDGVAERRGIGFVRQEDFVTKSLSPGAHWKEILLG
ncbi:heterokaryon incompatibility protein-domain-containing protein [Nemania sp. FL0031]|nr:heterokaryon incompatibility protein-domain-containing protein [Nemania sp. FL0031]